MNKVFFGCMLGLGFMSSHAALAAGTKYTVEYGTDRQNTAGSMVDDYEQLTLAPGSSPTDCAEACLHDPRCRSYAFVYANCGQGDSPRCWKKQVVQPSHPASSCIVSGYTF